MGRGGQGGDERAVDEGGEGGHAGDEDEGGEGGGGGGGHGFAIDVGGIVWCLRFWG